jgi:hypothetical protein
MGEGEEKRNCGSSVNNGIATIMYKIGHFDATHPKLVISLALLFTVLCATGMTRFETENRSEKLWVPQDSQTLVDYEEYQLNYGVSPRQNCLILESTSSNIVTAAATQDLNELHGQLTGISVDPDLGQTLDGQALTLDPDLCFVQGEGCKIESVLAAWNYDTTAIDALTNDASVSSALAVGPSGRFSFPTGEAPYASSLVSTDYTVNANGEVATAAALQQCYWLKTSIMSGNPEIGDDPAADDWEERFIDIALDFQSDAFIVHLKATISGEIENGASITKDIQYVSLGYVLIIVYCCILISVEGHGNCCLRRLNGAALAMCGIASVAMATVASFGLSSAIGQFYSPLHTVLPFILLGIGVDDMFVIVSAFSLSDNNLPLEERIALSLSHSGSSITVTSVTDFLAFAVGASTVLPALSTFCVYAAIGILFDFIFQITFFVACLSLHSQGKCCMGCGTTKEAPDTGPSTSRGSLVINDFLANTFGPMLLNPVVKGLVLLATAAMAGAGIAGSIALETDFDPEWFTLDSSYLKDYQNAQEEYFSSNSGPPVYLVMNMPTDLEVPAVQAEFLAVETAFQSNSYISGNTDFWLRAFLEEAASKELNITTADAFYTAVDAYVAPIETGSRFARDLVWIDAEVPTAGLVTHQMRGISRELESSQDR